MSRIAEEVLEANRQHALGVVALDVEAREQLRERIFFRYGGRSNRLWATAGGCTSVQDKEGWQWIRDFIGWRSCVIFFDPIDEVEMFYVPSGMMLHELLGNTFGFVFYVTDMDGSFLISFNDHDFLKCCGSAQPWLRKRLTGADC